MGTPGQQGRRPAALTLAVAVVLAVVASAATVLPPRLQAGGGPARPPTGPGALPRTLHPAEPWTPTVMDAPISRAAYVVLAPVPRLTTGAVSLQSRVWVVGADDGALRRLPTTGPLAVDVSPDGRYVAWTGEEVVDAARYPAGLDETGAPYVLLDPETVVLLDVRTGTRRHVTVGSPRGEQFWVDDLKFDVTGSVLLVSGTVQNAAATRTTPTVAVVDLATGAVRPLCSPRSLGDRGAAWRSADVVAAVDCRPVGADGWIPAATGDAAARLAAVRVVPLPRRPASDFTSGSLLFGFSDAGAEVAPDGVRWVVTPDAAGTAPSDVADESDLARVRDAWLVTSTGLRVGLGRLGGARTLTGLGPTAVLSTWSPEREGVLSGPSSVLRVDLRSGAVRTLSSSSDGRARAVAVAADVAAGDRFLDADPRPAALDPAFWGYAAARGRFDAVWAAAALLGAGGLLLLVLGRRREGAS